MAIAGQSILLNANAPNFGAMYVMLDDFHHRAARRALRRRRSPRSSRRRSRTRSRTGWSTSSSAPPVDGLGTAGGFKIVVEDRGDLGPQELEDVADRIVASSHEPPHAQLLTGLFTSFRANTPWLYLDIDRDKAKLAGVSIAELFNTLQVYLARSTSTTSTASAAPGRSTCRARPTSASRSSDLKQLQVRNDARRDGAAGQRSPRSATSAAR